MKKRFFTIIFIFLILIIDLTPKAISDDIDEETIDASVELLSSSNISQSSIKSPDINSRSCVIIDRATNTILFGKNENEIRKMASTTKIMTATIIIENCNLYDTIEVSKKAAGIGGSRLGLKAGDKITIIDLLYGLMLCSGNDAAIALAEYAGKDIKGFAELMNLKASSLGLSNSHFETPHGLDSDGHYTTAYELAVLSNYALKNEIFAKIVGTKNYTITINGLPKNISNTNELLGNLNGVYGVKTGFTNGANRCLVTACKRNNMDIVCVVLGADTKKFRTSDSIKLINYVFENFEPVNLETLIKKEYENWKNKNSEKFIINKGCTQNINFELENITTPIVPIKKDSIDSISISINSQTYYEAPLPEKTIIGTIELYIANNLSYKYNIYTTAEIRKKNSKDYLLYFLKNFNTIFQDFL